MSTKRILAVLLALAMVFSLVSCGKTADEPEDTTAAESTPAEESKDPEEAEAAVEYPEIDAGEIAVELGSAEGGTVGHDVYAGIEGKDYTDEEFYTFNDYIAATTSMNWNPLAWETSDDSHVLDYISTGFYSFALNSDKTGWSITCELAADYPVDVTAEYAGQFGIAEGETAKAWKIALNENACWEDGTPINADSYIYSYQQLLDPAQLNRRADSLYAGDFRIYGAKEFFYSGRTSFTDTEGAYAMADLTKGDDGNYVNADGNAMYIGLYFPSAWCGGDSLGDYVDAYGEDYFDVTNWAELAEMADANGLVPLNDETYALFVPVTTGNEAWGETEDDVPNYFVVAEPNAEYSWDEVGILKTGDYELVFITVAPTEQSDYYVPYNLSSTYLVYEDKFEANKSYFDADGNACDAANAVTVTNTYGTSAETSMSYGPYRLDYFELDKQITFARNDAWYGYSDGNHLGQYQADAISCQVIAKQETALLAFLNGEIDNVSLVSADMATYGTSDYIRYTPQDYTTKLTFNTDEEKLAERGTQVLGNLNFRKAFSLAIDRSTFAASYTAAGSAGYGMLNYMYVYDPFTGAAYRNNDAAKAALCDLYGLTYGDDGDFDDIDEAYDAITGYDIEQARECMATAYAQCIADGSYDGESNVEITLSVYQSDDVYVQMFNYLNDALQSACEGTGFEGKVSLTMKVDGDYYETMYAGNTDIIFSTWGGAAYSPFTLLYECYCDAGIADDPQQMEYGFDSSKCIVTLVINGSTYVESLQDWALWIDGQEIELTSEDGVTLDKFGNYDADSRCAIFAKMEYAYLANYVNTPVYYRNVGSLISQKGDYAMTEYVDMVGFGGLAFYTFNYTDAEWAEVAAAGLTY